MNRGKRDAKCTLYDNFMMYMTYLFQCRDTLMLNITIYQKAMYHIVQATVMFVNQTIIYSLTLL